MVPCGFYARAVTPPYGVLYHLYHMNKCLPARVPTSYLMWLEFSSGHAHQSDYGGQQLLIRQQLSLMRALLPVSPGAAAAPGLLATALRRRERDAIEILFCSLLQDCCPSVRARVLVEDFDGTPLIAQLISLYPGCIARVLNEKALGLKTAWEIVGDRPSCESFVLCTNILVSHTDACNESRTR